MIIELTLPYPPSANRYWRSVRGRVLVSAEARAYKERVRAYFSRARPLTGPVGIDLRIFRPRKIGDLDNAIKVLLDALRGMAYLDDRQVVVIHAWRYDDAKRPRAEITIAGATVATDAEILAAHRPTRKRATKASPAYRAAGR